MSIGYEQAAAVDKAEAWTAEQAERLGISNGEIMAAVMRGWTPKMIGHIAIANAGQLGENPPPANGMAAAIRKIRNAPILSLRLDFETRRRLRLKQ